ncbi:MAG: hypothetical protein H0U76_04750, partial [Ktedonobacteraceae bacterium]|nr:hypothetical protein [Ktedonobacteraceae bacterium]
MYPSQPPEHPSSINIALPKDLDEIILKALSADPAQRFSSAQTFSERLQEIAKSISFRPSPRESEQITNPGVSTETGQYSSATKGIDEFDKLKSANNGFQLPATSTTNVPTPSEEETNSIDLQPVPRGGGRNTVDLNGATAGGAVPAALPVEPPASRDAVRRLNGGGVAAAGLAGGLALGARAAAASARSAGALTAASGGTNAGGAVVSSPHPAGVPPQRGMLPGRGRQGSPPPRRGRVLLALLLLLLLLLASTFFCVAVNPGILPSSIIRPISGVLPGVQPVNPATITITPDSKEVQDSYVMQAVTNQPNADQLQVSMRNLNVTPDAQSKTVVGTGRGQIAGVAAKGRLTFLNGSFDPYTIASGTVINAVKGVSVITEQPAVVPAGVPGGANGSVSTPAHAVTTGTAGNLDQGSINKKCCSTVGNIFVKNDTAFTGGIDPKSYLFVQQGDVNAVAVPLENAASQQASTQFKQQLKPNEKLVVGPNCKPTIQIPAGMVGDQGHTVASTTVTVTASCTWAAYDRGAAQAIAKDRLQKKASIDPGQGYTLVGNIVPDVTVSKVNAESVSLLVNARGIWAYQFD